MSWWSKIKKAVVGEKKNYKKQKPKTQKPTGTQAHRSGSSSSKSGGGSKSTGTSNHRGGSSAPSNQRPSRPSSTGNTGAGSTGSRPSSARTGAVGAASKGSVAPRQSQKKSTSGAIGKSTTQRFNGTGSRSGAIGAASKGAVNASNAKGSKKADNIAGAIGYGLGYIEQKHAKKATDIAAGIAQTPKRAMENAGHGHKAGETAPTKGDRLNDAQKRAKERHRLDQKAKQAQTQALKDTDYKNYQQGYVDKNGNIAVKKGGKSGANVRLSQKAEDRLKEKSKAIDKRAEEALNKGAASFSDEKKSYSVPIYTKYQKNKAQKEADNSFKQAQSGKDKDFERIVKESSAAAEKEFDDYAKSQGWGDDTILTGKDGKEISVAEYKKQYMKDADDQIRSQALFNLKKNLRNSTKDAGEIKLSGQDIYKGGVKMANELIDYAVPYAATTKGAMNIAEAAVKAGRAGKAGKVFVETGEKGAKKLTKDGKAFIQNELREGLKAGKSRQQILADIRKEILKSNTKTSIKKELLANAMQDAVIGTSIDLEKGINEGYEGKELEKYMAENAAMNLVLGAPISAIAGRTGKAGKAALTQQTRNEINSAFAKINEVGRADSMELLRIEQRERAGIPLTETEKAKRNELQTKMLENRGGIAQMDAKGRLVANDGTSIKGAISPKETREFARLQEKEATGALTEQERASLKSLSNKVEGAYRAVEKNANAVLKYGGRKDVQLNRRTLESAVNFFKRSGDEKKLKKAQKLLDADIKRAVEHNESLAKAMDVMTEKTGIRYRFVDSAEMDSALGRASQDNFFIKGVTTTDEEGKPVVLINRDTPQAHQTVIGHETGHLIKDSNEEEFVKLGEMLRKYSEEKGEFEAFEKEMRENYPELDKAGLDEEITCELLGRHIFGGDDTFINRLAGEQPSTFRKIVDYIKELAEKIKNPEMAEQLKAMTDSVEELIGKINAEEKAVSYDSLIKKSPIAIKETVGKVPLFKKGVVDVNSLKKEVKRIARSRGNSHNTETQTFLHNNDQDVDIRIETKAITHGVQDPGSPNGFATAEAELGLPDLVENAIMVNHLRPRNGVLKSDLYAGAVRVNGTTYIARFRVDQVDASKYIADEFEIVHRFRGAKAKEMVGSHKGEAGKPVLVSESTNYSVDDFLSIVNEYYPDTLSNDVLAHFDRTKKDVNESYAGNYNLTGETLYSKTTSSQEGGSSDGEELRFSKSDKKKAVDSKDISDYTGGEKGGLADEDIRTATKGKENLREAPQKVRGLFGTETGTEANPVRGGGERYSAVRTGGLGGDVLSGAKLRKNLADKGVSVGNVVDRSGDPEAFIKKLQYNAKSQKYGVAVDSDLKAEDLKGARLFSSNAGNVTVGVKPDGDIFGLAKHSSSADPKALDDAMYAAIANGGIKMDAYGKALANKYQSYGFEPVARVEFNPEYISDEALPIFEKMAKRGNKPDVYVFKHNGDSIEEIARKKANGEYKVWTQKELNNLPTYEYDDALKFRDRLIADEKNPVSFEGAKTFDPRQPRTSERAENPVDFGGVNTFNPKEPRTSERAENPVDFGEGKTFNPKEPRDVTAEPPESPVGFTKPGAERDEALGGLRDKRFKTKEEKVKSNGEVKDDLKSADDLRNMNIAEINSEIRGLRAHLKNAINLYGEEAPRVKQIRDKIAEAERIKNEPEGGYAALDEGEAPKGLKGEKESSYHESAFEGKEADYGTFKDLQEKGELASTMSAKDDPSAGVVNKTKEELGKATKARDKFFEAFVDELYAFEKIARSIKNKAARERVLAQVNQLRVAKRMGQAAMEFEIEPMFKKYGLLGKRNAEKMQAFEDYVDLKHNIDRIRHDTDIFGRFVDNKQMNYAISDRDEALSEIAQYKKLIKEAEDAGEEAKPGWNKEIKRLEKKVETAEARMDELREDGVKRVEAILKDLEKQYGDEIVNFQKEVVEFADALNKKDLEAGIIAKDGANGYDTLKKEYQNYVPTYRQKDFDEMLETNTFGEIDIAKGMKKAKGASPDDKLVPLYNRLMAKANKVAKRTEENRLIQMVADVIGADEKDVSATIKAVSEEGETNIQDALEAVPHTYTENGKYKVLYYVDGKAQHLEITESLYRELNKWSGVDKMAVLGYKLGQDPISKAVTPFARGFKAAITDYNVLFGAKNFVRDQQTALLYTKDIKGYVTAFPKVCAAMIHPKLASKLPKPLREYCQRYRTVYDAYLRNGGKYSPLVKSSDSVKAFEKWKKASPLEWASDFNAVLETFPRMQEFTSYMDKEVKRLVKRGVDRDEAYKQLLGDHDAVAKGIYLSKDITINFDRGGTIGKWINRSFVPFFNPAVQGLDKTVRFLFKDNKSATDYIKMMGYLSVGVVAPGLLFEMKFGDDKDYQSLSNYYKDNYYCWPIGDGKFIKIPKARELGALQNPIDHYIRHTEFGQPGDWKEMFKLGYEQIGPVDVVNDNMFSPIYRVINNKNWYGGQIENKYDIQLIDEGKSDEVFDENTSMLAIKIGKQKWFKDHGISPKKIDNVMDSYLGVFYDMGIGQFNEANNSTDSNKDKVMQTGTRILKTNFVVDSYISHKYSGAFYDKQSEIYVNIDKAEKGTQKYRDAVAAKRRFSSNFAYDNMTFQQAISDVKNDKNLSGEEKAKRTRELKYLQRELQRDSYDGKSKTDVDIYDTLLKYYGLNKTINKYSYTAVDAQGKKTNALKDSWKKFKESDEYKNDKKAATATYAQTFKDMRKFNRTVGESSTNVSWDDMAFILTDKKRSAKSDKEVKNLDAVKRSFGIFDSSMERADSYYGDFGGTLKEFTKDTKKIVQSSINLGYEYTNEIDDAEAALALAKGKTLDRGYYAKKIDSKTNPARCVVDGHGWTDQRLSTWAAKNNISSKKCENWIKYKSGDCTPEYVADCIKKNSKEKSREGRAALFALYFPNEENPFGEIGDYSLDGDVGAESGGKGKGYGWGRRGRRGYGRRGRGGGGGSGGSGQMPTTASGAIKGKVTDPFAKVSKVGSKSNLDDAYRKKARKLREASAKKLS